MEKAFLSVTLSLEPEIWKIEEFGYIKNVFLSVLPGKTLIGKFKRPLTNSEKGSFPQSMRNCYKCYF